MVLELQSTAHLLELHDYGDLLERTAVPSPAAPRAEDIPVFPESVFHPDSQRLGRHHPPFKPGSPSFKPGSPFVKPRSPFFKHGFPSFKLGSPSLY